MKGRVGMFFSSYGVTVAFAIMVSLFVSFTLTPMLASRFLRHTGDPRQFINMGDWITAHAVKHLMKPSPPGIGGIFIQHKVLDAVGRLALRILVENRNQSMVLLDKSTVGIVGPLRGLNVQ